MIVGVTRENYNVRRNIIANIENVSYKRLYDFSFALACFAKGLNRFGATCDFLKHNYKFSSKYLGSADVLHLWNGISFADIPWVTTFESALPRSSHFYDRLFGKGGGSKLVIDRFEETALQALENERCIAIFALSKSAFNIQAEIFKTFGLRNSLKKMRVLHPPQKIINTRPNNCYSELRFMFVGASFFRKGGREIISAMKKLKKSGYPIKLTVVSCLEVDAYATAESNRDVILWKDKLNANSDWITWMKRLPNHSVLQLMQQNHIGLLPTHADTYGYSVLEFQANGCPVISTDVRALSEINNNEIGWLINVPKNDKGEALYTTAEQKLILSEAIENGIVAAVKHIFEDLPSIARKSAVAIQHLKMHNDPEVFSKILKQTYENQMK